MRGSGKRRFGVLGTLGSTITFVAIFTIIRFMPNGRDSVAGFPAMAGAVPFLTKDIVLLAVSIYLLKQDVIRISLYNEKTAWPRASQHQPPSRKSNCKSDLSQRAC